MAPGATQAVRQEVVQWVAEVGIAVVPLVLAIVLHEVAHGAVAFAFGDPTAARAGRLTLNPLRHVDPIGTVLLPAFLLLMHAPVFGWAKPVPVDFRRLRHPRRDGLLVALAGPGTNLVLATVSAFVLMSVLPDRVTGEPLSAVARLAYASLTINCVLAVFNLLPVPPLDGGRVLAAVLPASGARLLHGLERVGMVVILLIVMQGNLVSRLVRPLIGFFVWLAR